MATKKGPSPIDILSGKKGPEAKSKGKKRKHKLTLVEHDEDGKPTNVRHIPHDGGPEVNYAVADLDALHDGLEEHVGEPNQDEETA
jgi:hypothetical protein